MTLNLMRRLDFWAGVPLCFLLTLVNCILRLSPFKRAKKDSPGKILFVKPSEMGGILLSCSLVRRVQKENPKAEMFFLIFEANRPLFDVLDLVPAKNIFTIRNDSFFVFVKDTAKALIRIRSERVDVVFDLEFFSRFTAIISYLSGAPKKIGFHRYMFEGLYRGDLLTHKIQYNPHLHISALFLSMGQVLRSAEKTTPELEQDGGDEEIVLPQFVPTENQKEEMRGRLDGLGVQNNSRLFLVNPGEGRLPLREWSLDNFGVLVQRLSEQDNHYVIIAGTDESSLKARELLQKGLENKRCIDLTGKTSMQELLTLFSLSDALIANDSGMAHLASLTRVKQFVLFGPETPRVFSPLGDNAHVFYSGLPCSPCLSAYNHRKSGCNNNRCLQVIKPEEVYAVISEKMSL